MKALKLWFYNELWGYGLHENVTTCNILFKIIVVLVGLVFGLVAEFYVVISPFIILWVLFLLMYYSPGDHWYKEHQLETIIGISLTVSSFAGLIVGLNNGVYSKFFNFIDNNKVIKFFCREIKLIEENGNEQN